MSLSDQRLEYSPVELTPRIDRTRINFSWFHKLRWAAIIGQLTTIFMVRDGMGIDVPLGKMLAIIGVAALTNFGLGLWLRDRSPNWPTWPWRGDLLLGSLMMLDNLLLTALLYYSGGPSNPFTIFYLVNISLAAVVLQARWAWILDGAAFLCFAVLFSAHISVAALEHGPAHEHAMHGHNPVAPEPMSLHLRGSLFAFGGAATFIVYFITRVTRELAQREVELNEARQRTFRTDKLDALATLAAGAAHELASPLSTIAVVARELELNLAENSLNREDVQDVQLIRSEVDRCRRILHSMASGVGESVGEELVSVSAEELMGGVTEEIAVADRIDVAFAAEVAEACLHLPKVAVCRAVRAAVQNALDASPATARVKLVANRVDDQLTITVSDRGAGMSQDVLRRAGEPFFTTKDPGAGMGLGLFLARRVIERFGGSLSMESTLGAGTNVTIRLPFEHSAVPVKQHT
jgi:two-component system sensor histidine kinase RegB